MESDIKDYLDELYEDVEKKVFWEEAKDSELLPQPKSYFDLLMESAQNYDEKKVHKVLNKLKEKCRYKLPEPLLFDENCLNYSEFNKHKKYKELAKAEIEKKEKEDIKRFRLAPKDLYKRKHRK